MQCVAAIFSLVVFLSTDFARAGAVVAPAPIRQKTVMVSKPGRPNPVFDSLGNGIAGIGKGLGNVSTGAAGGAAWFFGELLRPVNALREGLINTFGVKENQGAKHG